MALPGISKLISKLSFICIDFIFFCNHVISDSNGDLTLDFEDLEQFPISVDVGSPLTVYGFLRDNNGTLELVVASEGALETSPGVANFFIY